jgi:hypothetical protein
MTSGWTGWAWAFHHPALVDDRQAQERQASLPRPFQVGSEKGIGLEGDDVILSEQGGIPVELAGLGQGEEPLDKVVDLLQLVITPGPHVLQEPTFGVCCVPSVEVHQA